MNDKLWNPKTGIYDAYDLHNDERIAMEASSGLILLFARIPSDEQARQLVGRLTGPSFSGAADQQIYLCPSYNPTSRKFNPKKYWRGPVWINMNWMLHHGLQQYGFQDLAGQLKQESLALISHYGFYEYFDPIKDVVGKERRLRKPSFFLGRPYALIFCKADWANQRSVEMFVDRVGIDTFLCVTQHGAQTDEPWI